MMHKHMVKDEISVKEVNMRKSVYIDTTIPSYYFEERKDFEIYKGITRRWWDIERKYYNVYISEVTITELEYGRYPHKKEVLALVKDIPLLEVNSDIEKIAKIYMVNHLMPKEDFGDAFHLALASFYKIDYLLTWNCAHLANENKQEHLKVINARLGLFIPRITTPMMLFREEV